MSFHEVRFPDNVSYGSGGGPGYSTSIIELEGGNEERVGRWTNARRKYDVSYGIKSPEQLHTVHGFYIAREGPLHGFRYKDWIDYATCPSGNLHVPNSVGSVETVTPFDQTLAAGTGALTQFQLLKRYTSGPSTKIRPISKPVAGTVRVAVNGAEVVSGWSVDNTTGIVTFTSPPSNGAVVTAGCEFDVPVRFGKEVDEVLSANYENFGWGSVPSIPLVELTSGLKMAEDANCGMSAEVCLTTSTSPYQISPGVARFIVFEPNDTGLSAKLPDTTGLPPGGPMLWLLNVGPNAIQITDYLGANLVSLAVGYAVVVALTLDGSLNPVWYII